MRRGGEGGREVVGGVFLVGIEKLDGGLSDVLKGSQRRVR